MINNKSKGKKGEDIAVNYLKENGLQIIETNWRYSRIGEIDIIAMDKEDILAFIEVKARSSIQFGHPIEAVNTKKMEKILNLAELYLYQKESLVCKGYRFDVVSIILNKQPQITYYKDVYQF